MGHRRARRFKWVRTVVLRTGICLALFLASGVAVAVTAQATVTNLGTLLFSPASGVASQPIDATTVSKGSSPGCPSAARNIRAVVNGPAGSGWTDITLVGSTSSSISSTSDFDVPLGDSFAGVAASNSLTIVAGRYDISLICQDPFGATNYGSFDAPIFFRDATNYQSNDPSVAVISTTTSVAASPSTPQLSGTPVTFTATVSPSSAAGTVQFKDGSASLGSVQSVSGGAATLTTAALTTGSHPISAVFTPSTGAFSASTASALTYVVTAATATTTTVTASSAAQLSGTPVTFTATVAPSAAAGTVQFKDGGQPFGSAQAVSGGHATLTTSSLPAGTRSISATFTPSSATYLASNSATVVDVVSLPSAAATATSLAAAPPSPVVAGTPVTFTATVTASVPGTVQFLDGGNNLGTAQTVSGSHASWTTSSLAAGSHSISAVFVPTDETAFTGSTSPVLAFTVSPATVQLTSTALVSTPSSPSPAGSPVVLKATVTPETASGSVQFKDGTATLGSSQPLVGGTASLTTSALVAGSHQITALFVPADPVAYAGSSSPASTYVIGGALTPTTTGLSTNPASPAAFGASVTLTASVTPAVAGTMQFIDGTSALGAPQTVVSGAATTSTATLSTGSHSLTAVFTPADAGAYSGSTSSAIPFVVMGSTGANLGTLSFDPPSGSALDSFQINTHSTGSTAGCPTGSTNVRGVINGPGWADVPAVGNTSAGVLNTADFGVPIGDTFSGLAAANSLTIVAGKYDLTLYCQDAFGRTTAGSFTGSIYFTDATHYQSTDPAGSTTTTTTSLAVGPDSRQDLGKAVTFMAAVAPANAVGTVQFTDTVAGVTADLGWPVALSGGSGELVTSSLPFGLHTFTVVFTPTDATKFKTSTSDSIVYVVALPIPPKLLSGAHIRGTGRVGGVLACDAMYGPGTSISYSWFRNGRGIPGAGRSTYLIGRGDLFNTITCRTTAKNLGGVTPSMSQGVAVGLQFRVLAAPTIVGRYRVGVTVVASPGRWSPNPQTYSFVWLRDGTAIRGATRQSYRVAKADVGHKLSVRVTVRAIFFNAGVAVSRPI